MRGRPTTPSQVFLTGFMGAGKTSVGRCLAEALALPFLDLDVCIEQGEGRSIASIFEKEGEPFFRELEVRYLEVETEPAVVALGGGAYMQAPIRALTAARGVTVFLDTPFSVLFDRIAGDASRPLATSREALEQRYQTRLPVYRRADVVWQPEEGQTAAQIALALAGRLRMQSSD